MLIEHELAVVKASRGLTGFELAIAERPDVIVLDLLLPDIDGFALAAQLKTTPATASIPIVALTGDDAAFARAQAMAQFSDVLSKPCPADRLLQSIHQARRT
jgi:two-component system cell cycle response regulator DivK